MYKKCLLIWYSVLVCFGTFDIEGEETDCRFLLHMKNCVWPQEYICCNNWFWCRNYWYIYLFLQFKSLGFKNWICKWEWHAIFLKWYLYNIFEFCLYYFVDLFMFSLLLHTRKITTPSINRALTSNRPNCEFMLKLC